MKRIRHRALNRLDIGLLFLLANEIVQSVAREFQSDLRIVERGERGQSRQASFQLANISRNVLRDIQADVGRKPQFLERRFLLDDRDAGFEIRRRDIGNQARFKSIAQSVFQSRDILRHFIRGKDDLMALAMQRIKSMKKLLLGTIAAGEELHVVEDERIDAPELVAKFSSLIAPNRVD